MTLKILIFSSILFLLRIQLEIPNALKLLKKLITNSPVTKKTYSFSSIN